MTTEQKEQFIFLIGETASFYESTPYKKVIGFIEQLEKQAAIDALAKAERIEEKQNEIPLPLPKPTKSDYDWHVSVGARCGALTAYLTNFIGQMTPDQREIVAQQFDRGLFDSDKAMAERFRNANNTSHENN